MISKNLPRQSSPAAGGLFISLEGGEGVGKSTFARHLKEELTRRGLSVVMSREPGGTVVADRVRQIFADPPVDEPLTVITELMLLSAARQQHVEYFIKPHLHQGQVVISDRFADSCRVYQGILGGIAPSVLEPIITLSTGGLQPDITFILDCDLATSQRRLQQRSGQPAEEDDGVKRFDEAGESFHSRLRQAYLQLAQQQQPRTQVINTAPAIDIIMHSAVNKLQALPAYINMMRRQSDGKD